jgi:hypothetical protein
MKITISAIKADVGSVFGHDVAHPAWIDKCDEFLAKFLEDYYATYSVLLVVVIKQNLVKKWSKIRLPNVLERLNQWFNKNREVF